MWTWLSHTRTPANHEMQRGGVVIQALVRKGTSKRTPPTAINHSWKVIWNVVIIALGSSNNTHGQCLCSCVIYEGKMPSRYVFSVLPTPKALVQHPPHSFSVFPLAAPSMSFFFLEPATVVGIKASFLSWIPFKTYLLLPTSLGLLSLLLLSIDQEELMEHTVFSWMGIKKT